MNNSSHHFNHQILAAMLNTVNSNHNNNTTTTSISLDNDQNSNGFNPMKQIPNSIMAVTVVLVNSFVLILFMLRPKLRKTTSNKILLSLVISDLTTGLIMILHVLTSLHDDTRGLKTLTALNCRIFLDIITSWLQLVTMGNLGLIIFERYITLIFPYKLDKLLNSKRICIAIHLIWLIALVIPCVQISWLYPILRGLCSFSSLWLFSSSSLSRCLEKSVNSLRWISSTRRKRRNAFWRYSLQCTLYLSCSPSPTS